MAAADNLDTRPSKNIWQPDETELKLDTLDNLLKPSLLSPTLQLAFGNPSTEDRILNPRYKTEICRNFKERSKCVYGDKCQFAHGRRELRDVVRNSKYKTKLCQKYWLVGYCAYGPRCNFLHDEMADELLLPIIESKDSSNATESRSLTPTNILEVYNFDSVLATTAVEDEN